MQVLHWACTWRLYILAGQKAWQAAVPIYSAVILMRILQRPWWWVILLYVPVAGNVMALVVWSDTCRAFGFRRVGQVILTLITLGPTSTTEGAPATTHTTATTGRLWTRAFWGRSSLLR